MLPNSGRDESLIARLLGLSPADRAALLERVCTDDPSLRERLNTVSAAGVTMPQVSMEASLRLSPDAVTRALESALDLAPTEVAGARIGPYKLLQEIGEGGFGVV